MYFVISKFDKYGHTHVWLIMIKFSIEFRESKDVCVGEASSDMVLYWDKSGGGARTIRSCNIL